MDILISNRNRFWTLGSGQTETIQILFKTIKKNTIKLQEKLLKQSQNI